jgi:flagellar motility protein MotE (MotC chaperone)
MKRLIRELRIIPIVVFAAGCLLALKLIGIGLDGGYLLPSSGPQPGSAPKATAVETIAAVPSPTVKLSWAQEVFGFPDTTASVSSKPAAEKPAEAEKKEEKKESGGAVNPPKSGPDGTPAQIDGPRQLSAGERAVLERLQDRRQELDARSREIDIRENLLKSMEKRLEARAAELKEIEARIAAAAQKKDEVDAAKFKNLVTMYENMKAKEAAKIFDRLDMKVLLEVASQIAARRMSDIMAQMTPEAAERLTVELANRATSDKFQPAAELPKIEGKANGS